MASSVAALTLAAPSASASASASASVSTDVVGASQSISRTWGVDGRVSKLLDTPRGVVVGGSFNTTVAPSGQAALARSLALWNPDNGRFVPWPVSVVGEVLALAVDDDTLYVGGNFTSVNGASRRNLAAVSLSDGSLTSWSPRAFGNVESLATVNNEIYVGGAFNQIQDDSGVTPVANLARVDDQGLLDKTWTTSAVVNDRVRAILPATNGASLYIGGDFTSVNGTSAYGKLARVGTGATAVVDSAFRSGTNNGPNRSPVYDLDLSGDALIIASGGGGGGCTRQDSATGRTIWSHKGTGDIVGVAVLGPYVYCAGHFSGSNGFDGLARNKMAQVVLAGGSVTDWAPRINSAMGVWATETTGATLVVGGDFTRSSGTYQPHFGSFRDLGAVQPPGSPVGLQAIPADRSVTLQWSVPDTDGGAKLSQYLVLRENTLGALVQVGKTKETSFVDTGLTNGTNYRYAVRATSAGGSGTASPLVSVTPDAGLVFPPTVPQQFSGTGGSSAQLSWQEPASTGGVAVSGYRVFRSVGNAAATLLQELDENAREAEDTTCPLRETCTYRVAAFNSEGEGAKTASVSLVGTTGVPATPRVSLAAGPGVAVNLSWTVSSPGSGPITRFIILRDGIRISKVSANNRSTVDSSVQRGMTYVYQVKAVNEFGNSANSTPVEVTVP